MQNDLTETKIEIKTYNLQADPSKHKYYKK